MVKKKTTLSQIELDRAYQSHEPALRPEKKPSGQGKRRLWLEKARA
jgi:hypothetical protein